MDDTQMLFREQCNHSTQQDGVLKNLYQAVRHKIIWWKKFYRRDASIIFRNTKSECRKWILFGFCDDSAFKSTKANGNHKT